MLRAVADSEPELGLALNRAQLRIFLLLAAGHLLFAAGMFGAMAGELKYWDFWILTPLFGLPMAVGAGRRKWLARSAVFLVGLTAIHYLATFLAIKTVSLSPTLIPDISSSMLVTGATGGAVGAAGSLALLALCGFVARTRTNLVTAAIGIAALTLIGAIGIQLQGGDSQLIPFALYTPWQLAFAYVLAKLLR